MFVLAAPCSSLHGLTLAVHSPADRSWDRRSISERMAGQASRPRAISPAIMAVAVKGAGPACAQRRAQGPSSGSHFALINARTGSYEIPQRRVTEEHSH